MNRRGFLKVGVAVPATTLAASARATCALALDDATGERALRAATVEVAVFHTTVLEIDARRAAAERTQRSERWAQELQALGQSTLRPQFVVLPDHAITGHTHGRVSQLLAVAPDPQGPDMGALAATAKRLQIHILLADWWHEQDELHYRPYLLTAYGETLRLVDFDGTSQSVQRTAIGNVAYASTIQDGSTCAALSRAGAEWVLTGSAKQVVARTSPQALIYIVRGRPFAELPPGCPHTVCSVAPFDSAVWDGNGSFLAGVDGYRPQIVRADVPIAELRRARLG